VARIRSPADESSSKNIYRESRERRGAGGGSGEGREKNKRARERKREREREGPLAPGATVLIWPSERDDSERRRDANATSILEAISLARARAWLYFGIHGVPPPLPRDESAGREFSLPIIAIIPSAPAGAIVRDLRALRTTIIVYASSERLSRWRLSNGQPAEHLSERKALKIGMQPLTQSLITAALEERRGG
jgi:hypothetical protein